MSSGAEIRPLSQWVLVDIFPNLKKKIPISKKKKRKIFFFFFFFFRIFIQSPHTHTHKLHDDNLLELHPISFNLMSIVCVIANFVFKLTKNAVPVCLENFPK